MAGEETGNELITKLKAQHKEILQTFEDLTQYALGEVVSRGDVIASLKKLKSILIGHIETEDKYLYSKLLRAKDNEARETTKKFSDEMLKISEAVFDFFGRYLHLTVSELETNDKFKEELRGMAITVAKRIGTEEEILFPLYEKYFG
jgi:hemerythrin-like domain-containing protein